MSPYWNKWHQSHPLCSEVMKWKQWDFHLHRSGGYSLFEDHYSSQSVGIIFTSKQPLMQPFIIFTFFTCHVDVSFNRGKGMNTHQHRYKYKIDTTPCVWAVWRCVVLPTAYPLSLMSYVQRRDGERTTPDAAGITGSLVCVTPPEFLLLSLADLQTT